MRSHRQMRQAAVRLLAAGLLLGAWLGAGRAAGTQEAAATEPRPAKVAGHFYPAEPAALRTMVTGMLEEQPEPVDRRKPRILIVPHAGYPYSGSVAAQAYRLIQGHTYEGVVVVGFTHRWPFPGVSVETRGAVATPLGTLPVDRAAVNALLASPGIEHVEAAHGMGEHSMEVQLPFLQVALGELPVVPILMGNAKVGTAEQLAEGLAELAKRGDYLFLFSTDLSHYHSYLEALSIDARTIETILAETPQAVARLFQTGSVEACGRGPILTSLLLAARLGYPKRTRITYANSGDTGGDPSRVVGYAVIAMYDPEPTATPQLSPEAGAALVAAARRSLERSLLIIDEAGQVDPASLDLDLTAYPELQQAGGIFVTLRKAGELRGCIGRIQSDEPLAQSVPQVALDAALRDHRFTPVTSEELTEIHVEVSVLTPPQPLAHLTDLVPGRDGVILEHEGRRGVFLPVVWEETGWTRHEFLSELASQKAGLPPDAWREAMLYTFQDQVFEEKSTRSTPATH